ncbi:MAG TPA: acyl-CoA dehydrogenase family protein [Baekduia sp.]|nr:acyl-CoA dehydrogenase family protein [Baekduia sp.]
MASPITGPTSRPAALPLVPSDEEAMLREAVAGIAGRFGHDYFARVTAAGEAPRELWDVLSAAGYTGVHISEDHGGGGLGLTELAAVAEEVAAAGCPLLIMAVSPAIVGTVLERHGTDEQKARWLRSIATGEQRFSFALTEPDAGSNSHEIRTLATPEGDGFRLCGTKTYISGVEDAAGILVVARTGTDERTGRGQLSLFMVDADADGLERQYIPTVLEAPEQQWTLFFDDVLVGRDCLIGEVGNGLRAVFDGLNPERIMSAVMCTGVARYALDKAAAYVGERKVWGVPIGSHQGVAHPLAEAKVQLELARLMVQKAAMLHDAGLPAGEASNMAKFAAAEAGIRCVDQAIQAHGGNGFAREYGIADLYWVVRLLRTAPVSREMVLNHVAEHALGLPRSY